MKKILTLMMILTIASGSSFAANSFSSAMKQAVKQDVAATKSAVKSDVKTVKNAVKQDIANTQKAQTNTAALKKEEKLKQINTKLSELNKELEKAKSDKTITETQRVIEVKTLQKQIDFYNKQKAALQ